MKKMTEDEVRAYAGKVLGFGFGKAIKSAEDIANNAGKFAKAAGDTIGAKASEAGRVIGDTAKKSAEAFGVFLDKLNGEYIFWYCDNCNAYLNKQEGFDPSADNHVCTKCGFVNDTTEANIKRVCSECGCILENQNEKICEDCKTEKIYDLEDELDDTRNELMEVKDELSELKESLNEYNEYGENDKYPYV